MDGAGAPRRPLHIAVAGKGGAGKSVIAATAARLLARGGRRVLALDSDPLPGLAVSLGIDAAADPPLGAAAERDERGRWRLRKGIGPIRALERYAVQAPDGVQVLGVGKSGRERETFMAASTAFHALIHRIPATASLRDWVIVGDLPAGTRQTALGWAPYAERLLLVVEPTTQAILTARRIARIATARRPVELALVVNKAEGHEDVARVEAALELAALAVVPLSEDVHAAERLGVPVLDHAPDSAAVAAIAALAGRLDADTLAP